MVIFVVRNCYYLILKNFKEEVLNLSSHTLDRPLFHQNIREDVSEYVAQLQLHMTLQARNLIPSMTTQTTDSRVQLLQETQANIEKLVSRQFL